MVKTKQTPLSWQRSQKRVFSESFKRQKVTEIERKLCTVREVSKLYSVTPAAVYKWLDKYSVHNKKQFKLVLEPMSDAKKIDQLQARIRELERIVGQKQIELEFKERMIQIAEEMYGVDIKKKLGSRLSGGSEKTPPDTDGQ
jgi:transposase-like protein